MKKILLFTALCVSHLLWRGAGGEAFSQTISFPAPELRVDTVRPLNGYGVTFMRPTTMVNKLTIKGNRVPPTFYFQIADSLGYNRFGVTKNGMVIAGTHHDPQVNVDGLALLGRKNALKGADAFVMGKGVTNLADTAGAIGYHFTQAKDNSLTVGYGGNRIEMSADSGRFVGNWKISNKSSMPTIYRDNGLVADSGRFVFASGSQISTYANTTATLRRNEVSFATGTVENVWKMNFYIRPEAFLIQTRTSNLSSQTLYFPIKVYKSDTEPMWVNGTGVDSFYFWLDTSSNSLYIILESSGIHKKIQFQ